MSDPAEIARRLTKAQSKALKLERGTVSVCRRLREKGLAAAVIGTGMAWDSRIIASPLGLAVRAELEKMEGHR